MRMMLCAVIFASIFVSCPGFAASRTDQQWSELIAHAKKHGGVETVLDQTASYVFQAHDGTYVTFTRTLDNKKRYICIIRDALNFRYCYNFDSQTVIYGTRADANAAWVESLTPPPTPAAEKAHPSFWGGLLNGLLNLPLASGGRRGGGSLHGSSSLSDIFQSGQF
jgi:hypothetical protein